MARRLGVVCAGILLFTGAGCSSDSFMLAFTRASPQQLVVAGSVVEVSSRIKDVFRSRRLPLVTKLQGDDLRMAGVTKAGKVFCLHLRQDKGEAGERTKILVQWDREADEEVWKKVLQPLAALGRPEFPTSAKVASLFSRSCLNSCSLPGRASRKKSSGSRLLRIPRGLTQPWTR